MSMDTTLPHALYRLMPPHVAVCRRSLGQILGHHKQSVILISPGCPFGEQVKRLLAGTGWRDLGLVFTNTEGGPLQKSNLHFRSFKPLLRAAGLPTIRFHDLRHTAATLLFLQSVHPKVVSELLGHASISITLDLYSHVLPNKERDASDVLDRLLGQ